MIRIAGLRLSLEESEDKLSGLVVKKLGIKASDLRKLVIFKQSIDARTRKTLSFVYTVDVEVRDESFVISRHNDPNIVVAPQLRYEAVKTGSEPLKEPPVIIGTGPAGLFAGVFLAEMGYRPLLLERGDDIETRAKKVQTFWDRGELDDGSNVQFGEGGAGTFSDGKLTTLIKDPRCRKVLEDLVAAGGPPEILYSFRPHIGSDILRKVVKNLRRRIRDLGGAVQFRSQVTDFTVEHGRITGVIINDKVPLACQAVILAVGHSARDTFKRLCERNLTMTAKPFSIGVRIEHPQEWINKAQYKEFAGHPRLGPADYKLSCHLTNGRSAYTFCMCPGGMVVAAASQEGGVVTNGMSFHARDGANANSALLVGVTPEDFAGSHFLAGMEFQQTWERAAFELGNGAYQAPCQLAGDFLQGRPSARLGIVKPTYPRGVVPGDLAGCLPRYVIDTLQKALRDFDRKLPGFAHEEALMTGVETRSSSPVRLLRRDNHESSIEGLYPAGEGAGYAGGIVSAAVDGLRTAEALARRFRPLNAAK